MMVRARMHRLYSLSVLWKHNLPRTVVLENLLTQNATDWIRFSGSQWYVWTQVPIKDLRNAMVGAIIVGEEQFIISSMETLAADGVSKRWIWDWLNDKMQRQLVGE